MNTLLLIDNDTRKPSGVIDITRSTIEDVEEAIRKVKQIDSYDREDLTEALNDVCAYITWIDGENVVTW